MRRKGIQNQQDITDQKEHGTCLKEAFVRRLKEKAPLLRCVAPLHDAAEGAVMEAQRIMADF